MECDYSGTKLCHSKEKIKNELCHYPNTEYDCMTCTENSSIDQNLCKCNDGYNGIGYIECEKEIQNNNETISDSDLLNDNKDDTSFSIMRINSIFSFINLTVILIVIIIL